LTKFGSQNSSTKDNQITHDHKIISTSWKYLLIKEMHLYFRKQFPNLFFKLRKFKDIWRGNFEYSKKKHFYIFFESKTIDWIVLNVHIRKELKSDFFDQNADLWQALIKLKLEFFEQFSQNENEFSIS
jgi:hypothetical protein